MHYFRSQFKFSNRKSGINEYCSYLAKSWVFKWFHHFLQNFQNSKKINHKKTEIICIYPPLNHLRSNIFSRTNFLFLAALGAKSFIIPSFLVTVQSSTETNQQNVNNVIKLPLFNRFFENENWLSLQKCRGLVGNKKGLFLLFGKPIDQ